MPTKDQAAYCRAWRARNKAHVAEYGRAYRATNSRKPLTAEQKARHAARSRAWQARNKERKAANGRAWRARNPDYQRERQGSLRGRFDIQRRNAIRRGIPFLLTFDQWWALWQQSGHWNERGHRRGQYVMSRHGDSGGYELGNVSIVRCEQNHTEYKPSAEARAKLAAASRGRGHSAETVKLRAINKGRKHSTASRLNMSIAQKAVWVRRKAIAGAAP